MTCARQAVRIQAWREDNGGRNLSDRTNLAQSSKASDKVAASYFATAHGARRTLTETLPPAQRMELRSAFANSTTALATVKAFVDAANAGKTGLS